MDIERGLGCLRCYILKFAVYAHGLSIIFLYSFYFVYIGIRICGMHDGITL